MYWEDTYTFDDSIEMEYKYAGNYGAKGEKRQPKSKVTPEQIKRQNHTNKINKIRRLIKANFRMYDHFVTLKYRKGTRKSMAAVKDDLDKFLRRMRYAYKKLGTVFKFILRIEIGSQGGIHIHLIINRIPYQDTDSLISRIWEKITGGIASFENLRLLGDYQKLAEYFAKEPKEDTEGFKQLSLLDDHEKRELISVSTSRNLIRPQPVRKKYSHWTIRRVIKNGIIAKKGYIVDKDSIRQGVNPITGMSYLKYTLLKIIQFESELENGG